MAGDDGVGLPFLPPRIVTKLLFSDLILHGSGIYKEIKTTICSVFPQVHAVTIDYNDNTKLFNSSFPNFINGTEPLDGDDAPWVGNFALSVFLKGLNVGQSTTSNAMGDTVLSFLSSLPNGTDVLSDVLVSLNLLDSRRHGAEKIRDPGSVRERSSRIECYSASLYWFSF